MSHYLTKNCVITQKPGLKWTFWHKNIAITYLSVLQLVRKTSSLHNKIIKKQPQYSFNQIKKTYLFCLLFILRIAIRHEIQTLRRNVIHQMRRLEIVKQTTFINKTTSTQKKGS